MPDSPHTAEPCRHCGGEPYRHEADEEIVGGVAIGCSRCGALGPFKDVDKYGSKKKAFAAAEIAWNTRTPDPEAAAEIKALREVLQTYSCGKDCSYRKGKYLIEGRCPREFEGSCGKVAFDALKDHRKVQKP